MKSKLKIVPKHVGIIMDGNGRWAREKGLPRILGHKEGLKSVRRTVRAAKNLGVKYLTLYSFSTENWKRPKKEVNFLFGLMEERLRLEGEDLNKNNVKVGFIGEREVLPEPLKKIMEYVEDLTRKNAALNLIFAINYGGRDEIITAVEKIIKTKSPEKKITEKFFKKFLYTSEIPDPDLIIRTAGEKRLSNFLTWQSSYSEFYFTPVLWPDFSRKDFLKALLDYQERKRKFGGL